MPTALAYNNSLLKFNNYVIDPGSAPVPPTPVETSDYKLVMTSEHEFRLSSFNPNVTSGSWMRNDLNAGELESINGPDTSYYACNGWNQPLTLIIANVSANTLTFKYTSGDISTVDYILYKTVDGTDTQIASGSINASYSSIEELTLNLT